MPFFRVKGKFRLLAGSLFLGASVLSSTHFPAHASRAATVQDTSASLSTATTTTNIGVGALQLSAPSVQIGGSLTASATLTNLGPVAVTLEDIVLAGRPPGGSNAGGPYLDFGGSGQV